MQRFLGGRVMGVAVSLVVVAGIVLLYRHVLKVNQTTVALSFLLAILAVSAVWGIVISAFMSVAAMLAFNYYFPPPVGTLTIADPQNWVALFAFLVTSITGSQLSSRIRKEADEAHQRRREVERLYSFSRQLLGEGNVIQLMNAIPDYIVESFEAGAAELFLPQKDKFYRSGFGAAQLDSITHDFRTPLTSMKAAVTGLLTSSNLGSAQARELLTIINEECDRLNHLVEEAGEMAKLEAGEVHLDLVPAPVEEIIDAALGHCKGALAGRRVNVRVADGLPPVRADLERAKEALVQLIENANLYSPKEEPITITAELTGEAVTISVADRGPGIDDFEQTMIFDKFYRGKDQRYLVRGTGMGLPIAKAIIEAQKGSISVTSQLGHGSVFSFTLPVEHLQPVDYARKDAP